MMSVVIFPPHALFVESKRFYAEVKAALETGSKEVLPEYAREHSHAFFKSKWCHAEVKAAVDAGKEMVPVYAVERSPTLARAKKEYV